MRTTAWLMMFALVACNGDDSSASADGSASDDGTSSLSTSSATTQAATDSQAATDDAGSQRTSGPSSASDTADASTGGFKFDLATQPDAPAGECDCGTASSYSYIWVANSPDSTVSKINTQTVMEEGRYLTRADVNGNPSRTSVSISGEAVAVANRHGGLIKIFANEANCVEKNGTPGIQTSTGAGDVLAWDEDECVHWYREFPDWTVQRPVAWAPGTFNEVTCQWENEQVWTAGCGGGSPGFGGDATTHVHLLDGETGDDVMTVDVTGYSCSGFGPYGGAVDSEGNFWLVLNNGPLAFIERSTGNFEIHDKDPDTAPYGLTVDSLGRPWVTSYSSIGVARFDPTTLTWALVTDPVVASIGQSGIAQGGDGRIWVAGTIDGAAGVAGIDPETLEVVDILHGQSQGKGVSVDAAGYVWRAGGSMATRFDADDGTSTNYMGLNAAYTYSDMTGLGVANAVGCNPAG